MSDVASTDDLKLYVIEGCGYCQDVRDAAAQLSITLEERDLRRDRTHYADLQAARGRTTVPVLRIGDEQWMGESQDIIAYLYERFGDGRRKPWPSRAHVQIALWGLLLGGGVAGPPAQA